MIFGVGTSRAQVFGDGSNTVVRFHFFTGARVLGDVDVELFDHDKPATVRNFLLYVRNGSFRDVILNHLEPGVRLQGGGFTNSAPITNSNSFLEFGSVRSLGPVTNEFNVGPHLSNTYGTLAMAKLGSNPQLSTSEWFFNLGDNSSAYDTQDGGYTVFGRVLPSTNAPSGSAGTNLLNTFNSFSRSNGIVDVTSFFGAGWGAFTDLPVDYLGSAVPNNNQLFYVSVTELTTPSVDTNAPSIAITDPSVDVVVTNGILTFSGIANDDVQVDRVIYTIGQAQPNVASGTTNWSFTVPLALGTNVIGVQSVDTSGNTSPLVQRRIRYVLPSQSNLSNSVVRFHIFSGDGPIGDIDVELFNTDKPETVKNFLLYVRNGSYSNVLLHRLIPGFVLQGGGFTNAAPPTSSSPFIEFGEVRNLGKITNEFNVGPFISNTYGTLSMAKLGGDPNSASSQWFFNLGNNSANLDQQNGGFTVFGRILPGTNGTGGTNLLNTFNALSHSNGIVNMTNFYGAFWQAFDNLPVTYLGSAPPQSRQLYYVSVSELEPPPADTILPGLTIASPSSDLTVSNANLTFFGSATDDRGVARVLYYLGDTTPRVASGTTNWSFGVTLNAGTNIISVRSVDTSGNLSPLVQRTIFFATSQFSSTNTNTVVRFQFSFGTVPVGNVDVELFDNDKPVTVRNFLLYVRNGTYSNVLAHRLIPNFAIQGGGFTNLDSPSSSEPFHIFNDVRDLGPIVNEFQTTRIIHNDFGTLAMAKLGGNTNSASSQWFFNLGSNSVNLDSQNGGFTVFGRVLPPSIPTNALVTGLETNVLGTNFLSGTNLLNAFNALSQSNGIVNMTNFYGFTWSAFTDLPVDFKGYRIPQDRELLYVTVFELNRTVALDTNPPTVAITNPADGVVVATNIITISGTAADDTAVARVIYYFGDTAAQLATGTTNWSATVNLRHGTNYFAVQSVDTFGNLSGIVTQSIVLSTQAVITLKIVGPGQVIGLTNGQSLEIGSPFTVRARAAFGAFFSGWTGIVSSASNVLTFLPQSNGILAAVFKPLPFPSGHGTYRGLFVATNQPSPDSSGSVTLLVRGNKAQSGGMIYRGNNYIFHGAFDEKGSTSLQGTLGGQSVNMTLNLDISEEPDRITGVVFAGGGVAALEAYKVTGRLQTNMPAKPGTYNFIAASTTAGTNAAAQPAGQAFGVVKVARNGSLKLTGTLGDGTSFKQASPVLAGDRWPVFSRLYKNTGSILGWARWDTNGPTVITNAPTADNEVPVVVTNALVPSFNGTLYGYKAAHTGDRYYAGGYTNTVQLRGAIFTPAGGGQRIFNWTNGVVILQGGNLPRAYVLRGELSEDNTFTNITGAISISLSIDPATGKITGSFTHPVTQVDTPVTGMAVQGIDEGGGLFFGVDQTGSFSLQKQ